MWNVVECQLLVKPEVSQIVILHEILLGFEALLASSLGLGFTARGNKVVEADNLRSDKALLQVRVNGARSLPGADAFANRPGPILFPSNGQERNVACLAESAGEQRVAILKFFSGSYRDWLAGKKAVRGHRLEVLRSQA